MALDGRLLLVLSLLARLSLGQGLVKTPAQIAGQSGSKEGTCFFYGERPLDPQPALEGIMDTCCWYRDSTCCYWIGTQLPLEELWGIVIAGGVSEKCYYHLADIYCAGCAPNTNDFTTLTSDRTIEVTLCRNTCRAFYDACQEEAHRINIKDPIFFCENYQKIFRIDDDDDDDDDLEIRVSRDNEDRCFHSFSAQDGGNHISQYYGTNRDNCLPPLVKGEHDSPWPEFTPGPEPVPIGPASERERLSNFDFPFPLAPFVSQSGVLIAHRESSDAVIAVFSYLMLLTTLFLMLVL